MTPTLLITAGSAAIASVAGFALAWELQAGNITQLELNHAQQRIEVARANRVTIERATQAVAVAQADAARRGRALRRERDSAAAAANRMRESGTAAVRAAYADAATCRAVVDAYAVIHTESADFIREVVADADQCFSDLKLTQENYQ